MINEMHLISKYFDLIKNGVKKIEYRLNDEKRQKLKIGDSITFYKLPNNDEKITLIIKDLKYYNNLYDMYSDSFDQYLKDYYSGVDEVVKETTYYSQEEIEKYGCVSIYF